MLAGRGMTGQHDSWHLRSCNRVTNRVTIAADGGRHQRTYADHSQQFIAEIRKQARPTKFPDTEAITGNDP